MIEHADLKRPEKTFVPPEEPVGNRCRYRNMLSVLRIIPIPMVAVPGTPTVAPKMPQTGMA
jgi:hypothetical protein